MVHFITDILLSNHKVLGLSAKNFLILKNLNNFFNFAKKSYFIYSGRQLYQYKWRRLSNLISWFKLSCQTAWIPKNKEVKRIYHSKKAPLRSGQNKIKRLKPSCKEKIFLLNFLAPGTKIVNSFINSHQNYLFFIILIISIKQMFSII